MPFSSQQKKSPRKQTRFKERECVCVRVSRLFMHNNNNNNYLKQSKIVSIFPLKLPEKKRVKI